MAMISDTLIIPITYKLKSYKSVYTTKSFKTKYDLVHGMGKQWEDFEFIRYAHDLNLDGPSDVSLNLAQYIIKEKIKLNQNEIKLVVHNLGLSCINFTTRYDKPLAIITFICNKETLYKKIIHGDHNEILSEVISIRNEVAVKLLEEQRWVPFGLRTRPNVKINKPFRNNKSGVPGVLYNKNDNSWISSSIKNKIKHKTFYINKLRTNKEAFMIAIEFRRLGEIEVYGKSDINPNMYQEYYITACNGYGIQDEIKKIPELGYKRENCLSGVTGLIYFSNAWKVYGFLKDECEIFTVKEHGKKQSFIKALKLRHAYEIRHLHRSNIVLYWQDELYLDACKAYHLEP